MRKILRLLPWLCLLFVLGVAVTFLFLTFAIDLRINPTMTVGELQLKQQNLSLRMSVLDDVLDRLERDASRMPLPQDVGKVRITVYHAVPEQTDDSPTVPAWGDDAVRPGLTCAVSHDLIWHWPYLKPGDLVIVEDGPGKGLRVVEDKMGKRIEGMAVDLLEEVGNGKMFAGDYPVSVVRWGRRQ